MIATPILLPSASRSIPASATKIAPLQIHDGNQPSINTQVYSQSSTQDCCYKVTQQDGPGWSPAKHQHSRWLLALCHLSRPVNSHSTRWLLVQHIWLHHSDYKMAVISKTNDKMTTIPGSHPIMAAITESHSKNNVL